MLLPQVLILFSKFETVSSPGTKALSNYANKLPTEANKITF
jgi:hypothetical protein